ncbi:hypothetical protein JTB14_030043 [Gonioctena quinquepunctata]|nr:hypothetical protein JTB14_030043 [Gonioctena quinquepunctata]
MGCHLKKAVTDLTPWDSPVPVNMDTRKPLHDNELADILTSEDFWADEEITIEDEAGPSGSQCMSADDEMDATNIILLDGDKSEQGESDHELFSVHDTDSEDDGVGARKTVEPIQSIAEVKTRIVMNKTLV